LQETAIVFVGLKDGGLKDGGLKVGGLKVSNFFIIIKKID
jgi:hypothetical protein